MKKLLLTFCTLSIGVFAMAQCSVDTIPNAFNAGGLCYIDQVAVNSNIISTGTGFQSSGPSYQSFTSPYVMLRQDELTSFQISFSSSQPVTICAWIDYDNDGIYSSTEIAAYGVGITGPSATLMNIIPVSVLPDTLPMRITVQQGAGAWGPGMNDACLAPGVGETEDYQVIIQCALPSVLNYDPAPQICFADSVQLAAFGNYDIAWYAGTPATLIGTGQSFYFHTSPGGDDTIIYVQSTTPGCFSNPLEQMYVTFLPAPIANILGPDTVQSCTSITIAATPGPWLYSWNAGSGDSTITFTSGFGGSLTLATTASNGCSAFDMIYVNIATDSVGTYATAIPGSSFCYNLELYLNYDSIIAPGTCTWYTYPGNVLIGSGSQIIYTLPDTGVYQFLAIANSMCGMDTIIRTVNGYIEAEYNSIYVQGATQDSTGTYVFCYGNTGNISTIITGLSGTVVDWWITDITQGFSMSWNDDDTLDLPAGMAQVGNLYSVQAALLTPMGCIDSSQVVYLTPANTANFNLSDSTWACGFPTTFGFNPVNYAVYDILWSTGDTTATINVPGAMDLTLYAIDHSTGCVTYDTTHLGDASNLSVLLHDTTFACNMSQVIFDASLVGYNTNWWQEYDLNWNTVNMSSNSDYYVNNNGNDVYLVFYGLNNYGCIILDTTYVAFNSQFTFSLGNDITTTSSPVTLSGPSGYPTYVWMPGSIFSQSIQVNTSGTYYLTIDNGNGCAYTDTIVVNILPMQVQENSPAEIKVFPNPANDLVSIQAPEKITVVNVYDLNGRLAMSSAINSTQTELNIGALSAGTYILETITESGTQRMRLVKQN